MFDAEVNGAIIPMVFDTGATLVVLREDVDRMGIDRDPQLFGTYQDGQRDRPGRAHRDWHLAGRKHHPDECQSPGGEARHIGDQSPRSVVSQRWRVMPWTETTSSYEVIDRDVRIGRAVTGETTPGIHDERMLCCAAQTIANLTPHVNFGNELGHQENAELRHPLPARGAQPLSMPGRA